jgi:UDP:flavonoid glycosyltransferase YjiC (YdhE family)
MAQVVVTTAGTMGDFIPFVALGKRLRERGHRVVMAVNPAMIALVEHTGLEAVPCGRAYSAAEAGNQAASFDEQGPKERIEGLAEELAKLGLGRTFRELRAASAGADLLVSSSLQGVAGWVHEAIGVPWVSATIFAAEFPHEEAGSPAATPSSSERAHWRILFDYRNAIRHDVGLPPLPDDAWRDAYWSRRRILVASSTHFSQPRLDNRPQARMTGFWFNDPALDWMPGEELTAFLDSGPPPLVLTLSSLPVQDPARVVTLHATAVALLGARLIVQQGWAGLTRENLPASASIRDEDIHFTGHVPHDWLFPRCAAVIHHGGIGTTAQAFRCQRPMLVEPYGNDQFFNAQRVAALGAGVAVDHRLLTPENLADALARFVLTLQAREAASAVGQAINEEKGLHTACDLIEAELTG